LGRIGVDKGKEEKGMGGEEKGIEEEKRIEEEYSIV
jgi:hypothetical protein